MLKQERRCTREYCIIPVRVYVQDRQTFLNQIREIGEQYGVTIVCLNQNMIAGYSHVETALIHALRSWNERRKIARRLEMEVLLYAAGTRQTGKIDLFGPETGDNACYLCMMPPNPEAERSLLSWMTEIHNEDWNYLSEEKKMRLIRFYGITPEELEVTGEDRVSDLIRERCALLTVNR